MDSSFCGKPRVGLSCLSCCAKLRTLKVLSQHNHLSASVVIECIPLRNVTLPFFLMAAGCCDYLKETHA